MEARRDRYLIWGGGGHGKVVADLVRAAGGFVSGYADQDEAKLGMVVEPGGARVIIVQQELESLLRGGRLPENVDAVALAIGDNTLRFEALAALANTPAPPLIHPTAVISPSASVGRGSVVFPRAVLNASVRVGEGVIVNSAAVVEHDCRIGDGAHLSPGVLLGGGATVGARTWIGIGATVSHGLRVGSDAVVGAGAVVIRDVPSDTVVVGNPARVLR